MLEPHDRRHLLEILHPPSGYQLDYAVGTTFSLDLLALLTVPLAFTLFDWQDESGRPGANPLAMLEAVRRYADRIHIFCQAGRIAVPATSQLLYSYLEDTVIPVSAPKAGGVFHPKVWVLRFTASQMPVRYRLLCLSRNLTFDRSWDTVLALEGEVVDRQNAYAVNHPLADFVTALPSLAVKSTSKRLQDRIDCMQAELRRVDFELPSGFESCRFWPLGIDGYKRWPFSGRIERILVVSPFLSPDCLGRLTEKGSSHVLVSRLDSLAALGVKNLAGFENVYALSPAADIDEPETDAPEAPIDPQAPLSGLHAKLYVADAGRQAHMWTGSANATAAAFNANVEFLVELEGKKSVCGVKAMLDSSQDGTAFADLLQPYTPAKALKPDPVQQRLERRLWEGMTALVQARLAAHVQPQEDANAYRISLCAETVPAIGIGIQAECWPITLSQELKVAVQPGTVLAEFGPLASESVTAFFAFALTAQEKGQSLSSRFVLSVSLVNAPIDRGDRILRALLCTRDRVMGFLMLLLAEGGADVYSLSQGLLGPGKDESQRRAAATEVPLFEALVRTLARAPEKLDQVQRLVDDLERTPEGRQLLPEGFDAIWQPIWAARLRLQQ